MCYVVCLTGERGAKGERGEYGVGQRGEIGPPGIPGMLINRVCSDWGGLFAPHILHFDTPLLLLEQNGCS